MMSNKPERRALRGIVWVARTAGWVWIALAILNAPQIGILTHVATSFRLLGSIALGCLGIAWVVGLELCLRSFDRYLSSN